MNGRSSLKAPPNAFRSLSRWGIFALVLILVLGGFLRFYDLGEESLWNDELESWRQSSFPSAGEVLEKGVIPDTHPPAFPLVLFGVERILGSSEGVLRLPSALSGTLSILVIFLLGWTYFNSRVGLFSALFMAVTWAPVYYSQEARNYALVVLLTLVASYFWIGALLRMESGDRIGGGYAAGYVLSAAASAYTHYFGLLLIGFQAAVLLAVAVLRRRQVAPVLVILGGLGLLYAPWVPAMLEQSTHTGRIAWIQLPTLRAFPAFVSFAFNRLNGLALVVIALYGWLLVDRIGAWRGEGRRSLAVLLTSPEGLVGTWLVVPIAAAFLVSLLWTPILTQRNLLICLPAAYLLLGRAVDRLPLPELARIALTLGIAAVLLYDLVFAKGYYRFDQKEQFREAVEYVVESTPESRRPPIVGYSRFPEYFDYYFQRMNSDLRVDLSAGENKDVDRLRAFLESHDSDRVWFISAHRSPDEGFLRAIGERYEVIDHRAFIMAEVRLLARVEE